MVSIVTHVADSKIKTIGENITALSKLHPFCFPDENREVLTAVRLAHRGSTNPDGSPAPGAEEMGTIAASLSMSEIVEKNGEWVLEGTVPTGNPDAIARLGDVKFVFAGANEKIIVVPHHDALEYAIQSPPLDEGTYAERTFATTVQDKVTEILEATWDSSDADIGAHKKKVMGVLKAAFDTLAEELGEGDDMTILYEQLGSYTCRQCG